MKNISATVVNRVLLIDGEPVAAKELTQRALSSSPSSNSECLSFSIQLSSFTKEGKRKLLDLQTRLDEINFDEILDARTPTATLARAKLLFDGSLNWPGQSPVWDEQPVSTKKFYLSKARAELDEERTDYLLRALGVLDEIRKSAITGEGSVTYSAKGHSDCVHAAAAIIEELDS